jgi:uncharacterized RDD family membrane protein YckC
MKCPSCGLENPPTAQICDCGYNFETHVLGKPILPPTSPVIGDKIILPIGTELRLAGLGSRWKGQFADGLIALGITIASILVIHLMRIGENYQIYICIGIYLGYLLLSDGFKGGRSFGKRIVNTAVVDSRDGKPCSYWQSLVRNITQVLGFIDWVFIFGKKRQRLGDKAARTVVVRV